MRCSGLTLLEARRTPIPSKEAVNRRSIPSKSSTNFLPRPAPMPGVSDNASHLRLWVVPELRGLATNSVCMWDPQQHGKSQTTVIMNMVTVNDGHHISKCRSSLQLARAGQKWERIREGARARGLPFVRLVNSCPACASLPSRSSIQPL